MTQPHSALATAESSSSTAPAPATAHPPNAAKPPLSCTSCRARKLKCDRKSPCRNCVRLGTECVFPARKRVQRPRQTKNTVLLQRVSRLEAIVGKVGLAQLEAEGGLPSGRGGEVERGIFVSETPKPAADSPPALDLDSTEPAPPQRQEPATRQKISVPKRRETKSSSSTSAEIDTTTSKYLSGEFWASLCEEVEGLRQALDSEDEEHPSEEVTPDSGVGHGTSSSSTSPSASTGSLLSTSPFIQYEGVRGGRSRLKHPPLAQLHVLVESFFDNVDFIVKIVHRPTIESMLNRLHIVTGESPSSSNERAYQQQLTPEEEALCFSIYFCGLTTLNSDAYAERLRDVTGGRSREEMLAAAQHAVEVSLSSADYLSSTSLEILQALTLYICCLRYAAGGANGSRSSAILLSLPIRLAQTMGLNRDGSSPKLFTPYVAEMRRRIWWQLMVLDTRASEDRGATTIIPRGSYDTRLPHNINDSDFGPETARPLSDFEKPEGCPTDVTFSLCSAQCSGIFLYFEFAASLAKTAPATSLPPSSSAVSPSDPLNGNVESTGSAENLGKRDQEAGAPGVGGLTNRPTQTEAETIQLARRLEAQFVAHPDPGHAGSHLASILVRMIIQKLWLALHYPFRPSSTPQAQINGRPRLPTRDWTLRTAVSIIELKEQLWDGPYSHRFRWWNETFPQWHPLAVALAELCSLTRGAVVERAWEVVDTVYRRWGEIVADSRRGNLWRPVRKLYKKAKAAREAAVVAEQWEKLEEMRLAQAQRQQTDNAGDDGRWWQESNGGGTQRQSFLPAEPWVGAGNADAMMIDPTLSDQTSTGSDLGIPGGDFGVPGYISSTDASSFAQTWLAWPDLDYDTPTLDDKGYGRMDWSTWDEFVQDTFAEAQSKPGSSEGS